jgi:hypothetical protein
MPVTAEDIGSGIPQQYRHLVFVSSAELSQEMLPLVEAFWQAVGIVLPTDRGRIERWSL